MGRVLRVTLVYKDRKSGFSLLEVLLAILLFTVGFVAIARVFSTGLFAESDTEKVLIATDLAQERIEYFRNLSYNNIVDEPQAPVPGFPLFSRQVDISDPRPGLREVEVIVYYPTKPGENSISLFTYVSDI